MRLTGLLFLLLLLGGVARSQAPAIPPTPREFRGVWIATHLNIDWPSRKGLPSSQQQAELVAILDRAVSMNANAIILQVRPTGETLYASDIEPWAAVLSGTQGTPPSPPYDPLAFAIREAHARGLQVHAWLNPFRVGVSSSRNTSPRHVTKTRPDLVVRYGDNQWMDPGHPDTHEYVVRIVRELIAKYPIDALHFDDYFYPYGQNDSNGRRISFPDDASFRRYQASGGKLGRDDWRRDNVNRFVKRIHDEVRRSPRPLMFGISPFGIWRPGHPAGVRGLDAYAELYADARLWMQEGWADYFAPQLYWRIESPGQNYVDLLGWWESQNAKGRHLWPGLAAWRGAERSNGFSPAEIAQQVRITQTRPGTTGTILYNTKSIMNTRGGIPEALSHGGPWSQPAVVPRSPWIRATPPSTPRVNAERSPDNTQLRLRWESGGGEPPLNWVLKSRRGGRWTTQVMGPTQTSVTIPLPEVVALTAVDRLGNESEPAVLQAE
jgi:uncharacterized lipoprotein YddW (UPF0748 family)